MSRAIGKLRHRLWTAELSEDGEWKSSNPKIAQLLNSAFSPKDSYSPSQGAYGRAQLVEASRKLKAEVHGLAPIPKTDDDDKVY